MLVRVQVRANIVTTTPHLYVYVCVYMSHTATVGCRIATDSPAPAAQGKPLYTGLL